MVKKKYIRKHIKRNIGIALICATIPFLPMFIISLFYDVMKNDTLISFVPYLFAFAWILISFLPIVRFKRMIARQEELYAAELTDDDEVDIYKERLFLTKNWLILAAYFALYKEHIKSIRCKKIRTNPIYCPMPSYNVTITTVDNKRYRFGAEYSMYRRVKEWWAQKGCNDAVS